MGGEEGGEGFGFARRDSAARKQEGRRPVGHAGAPIVPRSDASRSRKPVWLWLLTGVLLGTGGTLLAASFWLPENRGVPLDAVETDDHVTENLEGAAAASVAAPSILERAHSATTVSEPPSEPTTPAAPDIEEPVATAPADEVVFDTDDAGEDLLGVTRDNDTLDIEASDIEIREAKDETLPPVDGEGLIQSLDPEQTLFDLASEVEPTETAERPSLTEDRSRGPGSDQPGLVEPTLSEPENPARFETPADLAVAALPNEPVNDEPAENARLEPETAATEPSDDDIRSDLPPRIRQALREARTAAQSADTEPRNDRLYRVQLAAVDNEAAARVFWRELNERLPDVFSDVDPMFDERQVDERLYLRVWVGAFESRLDADGYCGWLKLKGQDCFVTLPGNR